MLVQHYLFSNEAHTVHPAVSKLIGTPEFRRAKLTLSPFLDHRRQVVRYGQLYCPLSIWFQIPKPFGLLPLRVGSTYATWHGLREK
jgi:hypothetical protein